ncbi:MAG: helix-turn-helix domain-containing protein [Deinococcales bacterium]
MTIGAFAKRTRLSEKALRLYDSLGLLTPRLIDAQSSYRYYSEEQLEKAQRIALLRQLDMPLSHIAHVLSLEPLAAISVIHDYWQTVEAETARKRQLVQYLENYLKGQGAKMFNIQDRHVPEQQLLSISQQVYANDLPKFIEQSMTKLLAELKKHGLAVSDSPMVIYHGQVNHDSDGPVEVCVPFVGDIEAGGGMGVRLEPAHQEAYTRISKAQVIFPAILEAYDAVGCHLKDQGKTMSASPREVYFVDWNQISDSDPACDIAFPYQS